MTSCEPPAGWSVVPLAELQATVSRDVAPDPHAEVRVRQQHGVGLYHGDTRAAGVGEGVVYLTSHSLYFHAKSETDGGPEASFALHLRYVQGVKPYGGVKFFSSPKIVVVLVRGGHTKLSFRQSGHVDFMADLQVMLSKRRWERLPSPSPPPLHAHSAPAGPAAGGCPECRPHAAARRWCPRCQRHLRNLDQVRILRG